MKIRLSSGSIRFRITSSELNTLTVTGSLRERIQMGIRATDRFIFEIHLVDVLEQMSFQSDGQSHGQSDGQSEGSTVRVLIPQSWLPKWQSQVGFEMKHSFNDSFLKVIVERDLE